MRSEVVIYRPARPTSQQEKRYAFGRWWERREYFDRSEQRPVIHAPQRPKDETAWGR